MTPPVPLNTLATNRYAQLRTYRRDGSAVDTPIWFAIDGASVVFRTKVGPKTRRIAHNSAVELWACDYRGRSADDAPTVHGQAAMLDAAAAERADRLLHRRYGWQYNVVPLLKLPGVKNVDHKLPIREKLRRAMAKTLWPDSAIIEVTFTPQVSRSVAPEHSSIPGDSPPRA
jgi:PPOX class probable F420-dependent enzyme